MKAPVSLCWEGLDRAVQGGVAASEAAIKGRQADGSTPLRAGQAERQFAEFAVAIFIDQKVSANYILAMDSLEQTNKDLERLEKRLRQLLDQVRQLREENESLQARQETLVTERATLMAKNDEARTKVEAMIHRLKALEQI
jgi:cell division protein ZapB